MGEPFYYEVVPFTVRLDRVGIAERKPGHAVLAVCSQKNRSRVIYLAGSDPSTRSSEVLFSFSITTRAELSSSTQYFSSGAILERAFLRLPLCATRRTTSPCARRLPNSRAGRFVDATNCIYSDRTGFILASIGISHILFSIGAKSNPVR